ncbi:MAG TPA: metallophosphoesterase family protein [Stellaceae bacterium]|nr:metallophosphoesterase family protein [Stellaceae bacterium]
MRAVAHISDLHFGRHDPQIASGLLADLAAEKPDLVAVSGDLTQRARRHEFAAARDFLDRVAVPVIAVPGNHDVPLYNPLRRALRPLDRFRHHITPHHNPFFADDELAVLGLNTARAAAFSNGRISHHQMEEIRRLFGELSGDHFRVLVTHHPLIPPPLAPEREIVGRAEHALEAIAKAGVDLLLTGHYHQASSRNVTSYHLTIKRTILVSQAGTAISTRRRGEVNSYNFIRVDGRHVSCDQREWDGARFATTRTERYSHFDGHWSTLD